MGPSEECNLPGFSFYYSLCRITLETFLSRKSRRVGRSRLSRIFLMAARIGLR